MEKQQQIKWNATSRRLVRNEMALEGAHHEHQAILMRQELMMCQRSLAEWRSCIAKRFKNKSS